MIHKISLRDFKEGTKLWLKVIIISGLLIGGSYLLSKLFFPLGFIFYIYLFILASPSFIFNTFYLGLLFSILPSLVCSYVAINYFYLYFKQKKTAWWLTTLFIVLSLLYVLGIIIGWFIFLVWHP